MDGGNHTQAFAGIPIRLTLHRRQRSGQLLDHPASLPRSHARSPYRPDGGPRRVFLPPSPRPPLAPQVPPIRRRVRLHHQPLLPDPIDSGASRSRNLGPSNFTFLLNFCDYWRLGFDLLDCSGAGAVSTLAERGGGWDREESGSHFRRGATENHSSFDWFRGFACASGLGRVLFASSGQRGVGSPAQGYSGNYL